MTQDEQEQPDEPQTASQPTDGQSRSRPRWVVTAAAVATGLVVGGALGAGITVASTDPTASDEYQALQAELDGVRADQESVKEDAQHVYRNAEDLVDQAAAREAKVDERAAELDAAKRDVEAWERAVTAVEQQIEANSIGNGIWTVGVDVAPGTYRVSSALTGYCYWAILRSGSSGSDIVENDGPTGGFPTVTLREGQDFENNGCGTFVKQ